MSELAMSAEIFAGALINIAEFAAGTCDLATKPISSSNLWKELAECQSLKPKTVFHEEMLDVPNASGWEQVKRRFALADSFEVTTFKVTELYHRLQWGLATAVVQGTAQTPWVATDRKIQAWVKVQLRKHVGTDLYVVDAACDIRVLGDPPAAEKGIQKPNLEFYVLKATTLNAVNFPV